MLKHIYLHTPLAEGPILLPKDVAHRLGKVLRLQAGAELALFNGQDGLWHARLDDPKAGAATCIKCLSPQPPDAGPTLLLACLKRDAFETALRQATEMGASFIQPVGTDFAVKTTFNPTRAQAITVEAAEQCERLTLPQLGPLLPLKQAVTMHHALYWAAEREEATPWPPQPSRQAAVLIGPEGGFSTAEKSWLRQQPGVVPVSLGANILRADTAVVAALGQLWR